MREVRKPALLGLALLCALAALAVFLTRQWPAG